MDNQTNRKDIPEVKAETAFNAVILDESIVTFNKCIKHITSWHILKKCTAWILDLKEILGNGEYFVWNYVKKRRREKLPKSSTAITGSGRPKGKRGKWKPNGSNVEKSESIKKKPLYVSHNVSSFHQFA